jgi:transposase InsO family protein
MKTFGFGGNRQIAQTLTPLGWKPSRRSVGRFCKEREKAPTTPQPPLSSTTVRGRHPNHLWLADITRIPTVFPFLHLHLAIVFDAFSRMPLRVAISYCEPSAHAMLDLLQAAIRTHGQPRHFVSDRGSQFTAAMFRTALERLGIRQRFGALYQHGSIALIERFFRTLKADLRSDTRRAWNLADLERRLLPALIRYAYCRPHSALAGRVPVELFFSIADQRPLSNLAPRGRPADPDIESPAQIAFLDPDGDGLPILIPTAA